MREPDPQFEAELIEMITTEITFGVAIDAETDLLLTDLVDSLGVVRIVSWIEERLDTEIDPGDVVIEHFQSVGKMLTYLRGR